MKTIFIQSYSFPTDWLTLVEEFDVEASTLHNKFNPLWNIIKKNILTEEENSVMRYANQPFLRYVCLDMKLDFDRFQSVPCSLIQEVFKEMGSETGIQYDQKLVSLFSELSAYEDLYRKGYIISNIERTQGSCDLVLQKGGEEYNCEVKLKLSDDRYYHYNMYYLQGKSYLPSYIDLCGLDKVYYRMKKYPSGYNDMNGLNDELDKFCSIPTFYDGDYITISSNREDVSIEMNDYVIQAFSKETIFEQLKNILIEDGRHLTKLIDKSKKFSNFIGYLMLSVPFNEEKSIDNIKQWFQGQKLDFDLYVRIEGTGIKNEVICIPKTI